MKKRIRSVATTVLCAARGYPVMPGRRGRATGLVLLALLTVVSGTAVVLDRMHAVPEGAALRVGNTVISEQDLEQQAKMMTALSGKPVTTDKTRQAKDAAVNQVLEDVAKERNIVIADKAANDKLTELLEHAFPQGRDRFMTLMNQAGVKPETVLRGIKRTLVIGQLFDQITKDVVPPTDQEVAQTYEKRKAELAIGEQRHVRNIAVPNQDLANQVRARLDHGEDFAAVAREVSVDNETKTNGGDLGTATRDEIADKAFGDAVFAAGPNSLFGPVQTSPAIWSVGQVLEVTPPTQPALEQVRDWIRAQLFQVRKLDVFNRWISDRLKDSDVRYAEDYRPADPYGLPTIPPDLAAGGTSK